MLTRSITHTCTTWHGMPYNYVKEEGETQNRKSPEEHQQNLCPVNTIGVVISKTVPIPSYTQINITFTAHYTGLVPILLPSPAVVCPHFHAYLTVTLHSCSHRPMFLGCIVLMRHTTRTAYPSPTPKRAHQGYMRGVDRGDQLIQYYNIGRRSKKRWKRVYSYILEVCCLNAYVLDKHIRTGRARRDYLVFRIELAEGLVVG